MPMQNTVLLIGLTYRNIGEYFVFEDEVESWREPLILRLFVANTICRMFLAQDYALIVIQNHPC